MSKFHKKSISLILTMALMLSAFLSCAAVYAEGDELTGQNSQELVTSQPAATNTDEAQQQPIASEQQGSNTPAAPNAPAASNTPTTPSNAADSNATSEPESVNYREADLTCRSHVQRVGWQGWRDEGEICGTTGRSLRIEALVLKLDTGGLSGGIQYRAHVQNEGWQTWKEAGEVSGTTGKSRRVEAIQIKLTGEMAEKYDVYYRVHVQSFGWMEWVKNGSVAGTSGFGRRAESLQIKLYPKGQGPNLAREANKYVFDGKNMYYRNSSGNFVKGWMTLGSNIRYFDQNTGAMARGLRTIGGYKYYFDNGNGVMRKGWQGINGKRYYFDSKGRMVTSPGWKKLGNYYYYILSGGAARTGTFSYNGYMVDSGKYGAVGPAAYNAAVDKRYRAAQYAHKYIGTPYRAGGTNLTGGVDCSGFIYALYQSMGVDIVRVGFGSAYGTIPVSEARPGDILSYPGHYSLYIGNGKEIHAVYSGVRCTDVGYVGCAPRYAIRVPI